MKCRHCNTQVDGSNDIFMDLGSAPPSNAVLCRADHAACTRDVCARVSAVLAAESNAGMLLNALYRTLQARAERIKDDLLTFLIDCKRAGKTVVGYGAAAKGNTLLNFAGVRPDLLFFVADASPHKQGRFLPGLRIPVVAPSVTKTVKPDYIVVLHWNIRGEVTSQLSHARRWGAHFVTAVPELTVA